MRRALKQLLRPFLPVKTVRTVLHRLDRPSWGGWRRLTPVSRKFGFDRGTPVDRYYIDRFLEAARGDIHGRVLEIADASYTRRFGGSQVRQSDVLHAAAGNPEATFVGNLATGHGVPRDAFDCIILTQTLSVIYDTHGAIATVQAALKPGGVVLATVSGISQISRPDMNSWGDYWRFTSLSARLLFEAAFGAGNVQVTPYGNVLAAVAFLQGLAAGELRTDELDYRDPDYEVLIAVRAVRAGGPVADARRGG